MDLLQPSWNLHLLLWPLGRQTHTHMYDEENDVSKEYETNDADRILVHISHSQNKTYILVYM